MYSSWKIYYFASLCAWTAIIKYKQNSLIEQEHLALHLVSQKISNTCF